MAADPSVEAKVTTGARLRPYFLIAAAGLIFFLPLALHPGDLLYSDNSDFLALHLPDSEFQMQSWHETGEIPWWTPHCFAGRPFVHDLYPVYAVLFLVPVDAIAPVICWLLVLHVMIAGWGMYAYARWRGLGEVGGLAAGFAAMFAGGWLLHVLVGGHYFVGVAWLPLLLLFLERAIRFGSWSDATIAALAYALVAWGSHLQIAFYAGLLIAFWTLGTALQEWGWLAEPDENRRLRLPLALGRWLGFGAWVAFLGIALAAIAILPNLDFARHSTRAAGLDFMGLGRQTLLNLVGPDLHSTSVASSAWEERGGMGLVVLLLAVAAPILQQRRRITYDAIVVLVLIVFALGGAFVLHALPGVGMFRQPARMFILTGFPLAFLAGAAVDAFVSARATEEAQGLARVPLVALLVGIGTLVFVNAIELERAEQPITIRPYWMSLLFTLPLAAALFGKRFPKPILAGGWLLIIVIDVGSLAGPYVQTRPENEVFPVTPAIAYLREHDHEHGRVLDEDDFDYEHHDFCSPLGRGEPVGMRDRLSPIRGYSPIDVRWYKEYLQFIGDEDAPLVALQDHLTFPIIRDIPVESPKDYSEMEMSIVGLLGSPHAPGALLAATTLVPARSDTNLLDLLGTRYLLRPADRPPPGGWRRVLEDPAPRAFDVTSTGIQQLVPYVLYENPNAFPRAFVAHHAETLPDRPNRLAALKAADLRKTVFLDGDIPALPAISNSPVSRPAEIRVYRPNEVRIEVPSGAPGFLILTDPWFPGWNAAVNGTAVPVLRADHAFRAVALPAEGCEVVFRFEPASIRWAMRISAAAALLAVMILAGGWLRRRNCATGTCPTP